MIKKLLPNTMVSGNAEIDGEHELILQLVELVKKGENRPDVPKDYLTDIAAVLKFCISNHLDNEDRLMEKVEYPDRTMHQKAHDFLRGLLKKLETDFQGYSKDFGELFMEIIASYLTKHIDQCDLKLVRFLKENQPN